MKKYYLIILITLFSASFIQISAQDDEIETDSIKTEKKVKSYRPKITGFIQFQTLWHFDSNGDGETLPWRFRVQRARLMVKGKISKKISYQLEIDPRAPEITGIMRDAFIAFKYIPNHKVMLGQQKTQFGYENTMSSSRLYFVNRTDVSDNLSRGVNLRDIGIGLKGFIPLNDKYRFEDAVTLVNGAGINVQYDNTAKKNIWGRCGIRYKTNDLLWRFGVSGGYGDMLEPADTIAGTEEYNLNFTRLGSDFQMEQKWFTLAAEYVLGWDEDLEGTSERAGYYCLLTGNTPWNIGPLLRYEDMDGEFIRWTIGAYYGKPADRLRLFVNYEIRNVEDDPEFPVGEDNRLYLWIQLRF